MVGLTAELSLAAGATLLRGLAATTTNPFLWYVTRATALAAYAAITLSVMLGMLRPIARTVGESLSWVADEIHQTVATLAGVLVVGHLLALRFDPMVPFSVTNLLLPINEPYRPLAADLGVLSLYAIVVALLSSWLRRRLPYRFWRGMHYVSFAAFVLVTAHGWYAGSDSGEEWMRAVYVGALAAVAFLVLMRLVLRAPERGDYARPEVGGDEVGRP
jgi:predicted ferric reductase